MTKEIEDTVEVLLNKAANAISAGDAMKYTQAALNAANVKNALDQKL